MFVGKSWTSLHLRCHSSNSASELLGQGTYSLKRRWMAWTVCSERRLRWPGTMDRVIAASFWKWLNVFDSSDTIVSMYGMKILRSQYVIGSDPGTLLRDVCRTQRRGGFTSISSVFAISVIFVSCRRLNFTLAFSRISVNILTVCIHRPISHSDMFHAGWSPTKLCTRIRPYLSGMVQRKTRCSYDRENHWIHWVPVLYPFDQLFSIYRISRYRGMSNSKMDVCLSTHLVSHNIPNSVTADNIQLTSLMLEAFENAKFKSWLLQW